MPRLPTVAAPGAAGRVLAGLSGETPSAGPGAGAAGPERPCQAGREKGEDHTEFLPVGP
jgi:hypothetical protein